VPLPRNEPAGFPMALLDRLIRCLLSYDPSYLRIFNLKHPIICSRVAKELLKSKYTHSLQDRESLERLLGIPAEPRPNIRLVK
jgi:hypothetical protein